jgi:mxaJ protein
VGVAAAQGRARRRHVAPAAHVATQQGAAAPYHLDLGPSREPIDAAVPQAFDAAGRRTTMRVCADPNNLPFSDRAGEGFENRLASLLAADLGLRVAYSWLPQRRGFVRNTLKLGNCDVIMGIAARSEMVLATRPYYRSTYVLVTRRDGGPRVTSLDDPTLRRLRIGMHLIGGDDANPPASHSLAARGLVANVRGYPIYGDYLKPDPPARLLDAVADDSVDVAIVWGPLAGYFARREPVPLAITPVRPERDGSVSFAYDIALGVRHGDSAWRDQLQGALDRHRADVGRLLADYGVPVLPVAAPSASDRR